jgi:hypothetical protein
VIDPHLNEACFCCFKVLQLQSARPGGVAQKQLTASLQADGSGVTTVPTEGTLVSDNESQCQGLFCDGSQHGVLWRQVPASTASIASTGHMHRSQFSSKDVSLRISPATTCSTPLQYTPAVHPCSTPLQYTPAVHPCSTTPGYPLRPVLLYTAAHCQ